MKNKRDGLRAPMILLGIAFLAATTVSAQTEKTFRSETELCG